MSTTAPAFSILDFILDFEHQWAIETAHSYHGDQNGAGAALALAGHIADHEGEHAAGRFVRAYTSTERALRLETTEQHRDIQQALREHLA